MKKYLIIPALLCLLSVASRGFAADRKYVVFITDWGNAGPSGAVLSTLAAYPKLRLAVPWPSGQQPPDAVKNLVRERRLELALTLQDEPLLPLLYSAKISEPLVVDFSWPDDAWDIIARSREGSPAGRGLYLRSGVFSPVLIPHLKRLGVHWSTMKDPSGTRQNAYLDDDFLVLVIQNRLFSGVQDCWEKILSSSGPVTVLLFDPKNPATPEFLAEIGRRLAENPAVVMATPEQVLRDLRARLPRPDGPGVMESDLAPWLQSPIVWYELDSARRAVEEYKNSGRADIKTLDRLRDRLYTLYSYPLIARLERVPADPEAEKTFQNGLSSLYHILNREPEESFAETSSTETASAQAFSVETTTAGFVMRNALTPSATGGIESFSVTMDTGSVVFAVTVSSALAETSPQIDVYMDLNGQEGAGTMRLLPGADGFMETASAWEFALRFEGGQAFLYRSGRFEPTLVATVKLEQPHEAAVPRTVLRGNPPAWAYQVVASTRPADAATGSIIDFLGQDIGWKNKIFETTPIQLPALRAQSRLRPPGE